VSAGAGDYPLQLGERPFYLVAAMQPSALQERLLGCRNGPFRRSDFSIAHRGAPLQFPEHTREGYGAAARMGAGIVECDVTFTRDGALVCRHDACDLHTTTNIVATALNARCTAPWNGAGSNPRCCASDLTLAEFRTLQPKMDSSNPAATTARDYLAGTPSWRTDLYAGHATLMTLDESIRLNRELHVKHMPELKAADPQIVQRVFGGQAQYAQRMIDAYSQQGVSPAEVWPQSFDANDILYWIRKEPRFGRQAVYLDAVDPGTSPPIARISSRRLAELRAAGVRILGTPLPALLEVDNSGGLVASAYAREIRGLGFGIVAWTLERSDLRRGAAGAGFYYSFDPLGRAVRGDGDIYVVLDALATRVGVRGVFSDWPATVSYYASCMGLQ
jgi:glycerophosphoryl diester phosphodiesterase